MKRIVVSCGPIPAKLDSVKFITNRFKGGLAFETAKRLAGREDLKVTIVKWKHTKLPWGKEEMESMGFEDVINVDDVVEYVKWFEDHAMHYHAFVMAAAVANLMPSNPYETKFPSHLYEVGEKFDIEFEIAPRAIDVIKKKNPRCCLIGYKLFDADTDKELIDAAEHTLRDSKANVIFANRPSDAKERKIAVMADGATIPMDFDSHIEFMCKAINAQYFSTRRAELDMSMDMSNVTDRIVQGMQDAMALVKYFEKTFPKYGTVAFRVPGLGMVTTARGHSGEPVLVTNVDYENRVVYCLDGEKATLNAPLLWRMLELNKGADYIIHRHYSGQLFSGHQFKDWLWYKEWRPESDSGKEDASDTDVNYEFPGTLGEVEAYDALFAKGGELVPIRIQYHGWLNPMKIMDVDWNLYYQTFPDRYFGTRDSILEVYEYVSRHPELESLEIGGNSTCRCKWNLDPNMSGENVISYDDLAKERFDIIVARNSINYLSEEELSMVMASLKRDGIFIANGFANVPDEAVIRCEDGRHEVAVPHYDEDGNVTVIQHFLISMDYIYAHSFYGRGKHDYEKLGFKVEQQGSSILIWNNRLYES